MKTAALLSLCLISISLCAQQEKNHFVLEVSPASIFFSRGFLYSVQGRVDYSLNKRSELAVRYNQTLQSPDDIMTPDLKPNPYSKSSYAQLSFLTEFFDTENRVFRYLQTPRLCHALKAEIGLNYFRQETKNWEYYTYDTTDLGQRKVIKGKNTLSLTFGIQYQIREYRVKDTNAVLLKRQHQLSFGAIYGMDYFLPGFVDIPSEYPSAYSPKVYAFDRWGAYFRYNFRQQITRNLFAGLDIYCTLNPYVHYKSQPTYYLLRGSESEQRIKPYAGITIGWAFN